ncbi:hotdog fold thioesterase, partial [Escherichia coli]
AVRHGLGISCLSRRVIEDQLQAGTLSEVAVPLPRLMRTLWRIFMMTRDGQCVVGTELNATHHRPVSEGKVRGVCQPLHLGRQNQSWEIVVFDEQGRRCCTCRLGTAVLG